MPSSQFPPPPNQVSTLGAPSIDPIPYSLSPPPRAHTSPTITAPIRTLPEHHNLHHSLHRASSSSHPHHRPAPPLPPSIINPSNSPPRSAPFPFNRELLL
ncbi:hypothetical protein V6N11_077278 [Hibiscus sabdariffa]|uniref:Uncharacterized protein n=1 Tax=Hibiscus sabdariffa TaxID=183260 RepID=A0ABR2TCM2_9ROSI